MRLLYCYIRFLDEAGNEIYYHGQKSIELNLSTKHRFSFYPDKNVFVRENRKAPLPNDFWARTNTEQNYRNIYNFNVIAGQNGSGKTTAIRCMMNLLEFFYAAANGDQKTVKNYYRVNHNQSLLLFEDNNQYYLMLYTPTRDGIQESLHIEGFSSNELLDYSATDWRQLFEDEDKIYNDIQSLLLKTKVIHITNTLNQYDYERNIEKQNEQLRDYFIFDASIGATIGPDVGLFFPYEIYKQVKYVFDKNQSEIRKKIEYQSKKKITGFKVPDSLRFKLRLQKYQNAFENYHKFGNPNDVGSYLVQTLGILCVDAFIENLKMRTNEETLRTTSSELIEELSNNTSGQELLQKMILYVEQQYFELRNNEILNGYDEYVTCLASMPDGHVISGSIDGRIKIRNAGNYDEVLRGVGQISCIIFFSGKLIAVGTNEGYLWIIDVLSKNALYNKKILNNPITGITVSTDEKRIYCVSSTGEICMLDCDADYQIKILETHFHDSVENIVVDQNECVYCNCDNGEIYAYIEGIEYRYLQKELGLATCMVLLPDNTMLVGSQDGGLYVWNPRSIKDTLQVWNKKHNSAVKCIAISPDKLKIVSATDKGEICVWDLRTKECLYDTHVKALGIKDVAILSDGRVFGCSDHGQLYIWDVPDGILLRKEQKQMLKAIEEDSNGKSKSTIKNEEEIDKKIRGMGFAHILAENCLRYIKYIFEKKDTLFNQMHKIQDDLYEISLKENRTDEFARDMIQFIQKYRYTCEPAYTIDFDWGLSSGEENMLRVFSDLYHIFDRDYSSGEYGDYKIYNVVKRGKKQGEKKECDTVLLFMDEADLTLHPEWQRCLIDTLTTYIPQVYPASCAKDIQLILTTHSPLLLGDIPSENIAYLYSQKDNEGNELEENKQDEKEKDIKIDSCKPGETFGQNIHTILKDNFFLKEGTVGAFAAGKINNTAKRLIEIEKWASGKNKKTMTLKAGEMKKIRMIIDLVAPGVLRNQLEELFKDANDALDKLAGNNQDINGVKAQDVMMAEQLVQAIHSLPKQARDYVLKKLEKEE